MTDFENDARKMFAGFLARPVFIVVGVAALVVFGFCWKARSDDRRDGQIELLTRQVTRDSIVVDSLTKRSKLADTRVSASVDTFVKLDTIFKRHTDTLSQTVTNIVTAVVPDSEKIRELAALVIATQHKADDAIAAAEKLVETSVDFRLSVIAERAGWEQQTRDQALKIKLLERQSRHFGLGLGVGYGATRLTDGTIRAGPVLSVGLVWRY